MTQPNGRWRSTVPAWTVAVLGTVGMTIWMANREPLWLGPLWGTLIVCVTAAAWVAVCVPTSGVEARPWRDTALAKRAGERVSPVASSAVALAVMVAGAVVGGYDALPITILVALLCFIPPALHRPGLAVLIAVAAIYLPLLGVTGLWDPWETHYGEVAREILARNDWISLWWAQDKWFWSKPVLLFWMEALSMGMLGVDFISDAHPLHPEWAIRLPTILFALAALGALYATTRHFFGSRTGALAVLVTATMPQFFFISHQAITDLPLVAAITIASCCLLMAVQEDPDRHVQAVELGPCRISFQHVVLFALFVLVLPQATYLISRNVSWIEGAGLVAHPDRFLYGSAGNVDVPGNPNPRDQLPFVTGLLGQPFLQGFVWLGVLSMLVQRVRKETRQSTLWMFAFYLWCALAFMAKGLPGLAIPGAAALFYLIASHRWSLLPSGKLHVTSGSLIVGAVSLPWFLAMYVRHGPAFTNRLLIHDHINRLATGVHGDTGTIEYFVSQLGYATFPWIALAPMALLTAARVRARSPRGDRAQMILFVTMWLLSAFALFSAMVTKFHHYILPAIVPAGVLIGIGLAECWGSRRPAATMMAASAGALLALGFAFLAGDPRGIIPVDAAGTDDWVLQQSKPLWAFLCLGAAVVLGGLSQRDLGREDTKLPPGSWSTAIGVASALGACLVAFVGRDLSWATAARPQGNERLIHLFVYNYKRAWPEHLDYRAVLTGFAVAAVVAVACATFRRWRTTAVRALCGVAIALCAWGLNVYMFDLSPHWSFRDLAARYYESREGPTEPLLAWQMNWKGENFYTGNRVHVFAETDNKRIKEWLERNRGRRVYFVLEHKRLSRFEALVSDSDVELLSTRRDNNKLVLVRVEIGAKKRVQSNGS